MNAIVITGSVGKTIVVRYLNHLLNHVYKIKTLYFELNSENKISKILVNNVEDIDIEIYRKGLTEDKNEIYLLEEIFFENKIEIILCKNNYLVQFLTPIVCGLTNLDYESSMMVEEILNKAFQYDVLKNQTPLVSCPQSSYFIPDIFNICSAGKNPIFKVDFYHLKYIKYNTQIKSRYSYVDFGLVLIIVEIYLRLRKNQIKFKSANSKYGTVSLCPYPSPIPKINNLIFREYAKLYEHTEQANLKFYVDPGGTFKSSNLIIHQFMRQLEFTKDISKVIPIVVFSCTPETNLFLTLFALTTFQFQDFYIADYGMKGLDFNSLLSKLKNDEIYLSNKTDHNWTQTIFETLNYIYTESELDEKRLKSMSPLNEYYGFEENIDKCKVTVLPKTPSITVDEISYINKWLKKLASKNKENEYYILVTGSKKLVFDFLEMNELIEI